MPRVALAVVGVLGLSAACAHAPLSRSEVADPVKMTITGSRIPRRVDPRTGYPVTSSRVVVYTRDSIIATGRPDLGAALLQLEVTSSGR